MSKFDKRRGLAISRNDDDSITLMLNQPCFDVISELVTVVWMLDNDELPREFTPVNRKIISLISNKMFLFEARERGLVDDVEAQ